MPQLAQFSQPPSFLVVALLVASVTGCFGGPQRIEAPRWEPEKFADRCQALLDTNADAVIDETELEAAPGLQAGAKEIDANADNKLDRDELVARFEIYRDQNVGLRIEEMEFSFRGKPLSDATIRLVPETFLDGVVEPAEGKTGPYGVVKPNNGVTERQGLRVGYYRIEVTSPTVELKPKYNSATTLGVEVAPVGSQSGYTDYRFNLK